MNRIAEIYQNSKPILDNIVSFVDSHIGNNLLRKCHITKIVDEVQEDGGLTYHDNPILRLLGDVEESAVLKKVVSAKDLLIDKLIVCFAMATSPYLMFKTDTFFRDYKKDTFYRFDSLEKANWERLQLETAAHVINDIEAQTDNNHVNVLIFDDSLYQRTGGKGTELCSKVYDHVDHKMRLGYRMMTGAWSNGETTIPFAQSLLASQKEELMVGRDEKVDRRTVRGKRRELAKTKGPVVVQQMVQHAQKADIPFDYVLFDTWFSTPSQLTALKELGADVIAMVKKGSTKYTVDDPKTGEKRKLDVKEIYSRNRKRRGRSKYLLSVDATIQDSNGNEMPVKLVYARNRNNRKDWVCFVCTDTDLDEEELLLIYAIRWNIEVYFKMSKSYLKLRTECHSPNYDAITSHMVIVALRYMIIAVERFKNSDGRSIEEIFYQAQREINSMEMGFVINLILDLMIESVREVFSATEAQIQATLCTFVSKLPAAWRECFVLPESA